MEQILIRNLPPGTKAALRARADSRAGGARVSAEGEARRILTESLGQPETTIVDLLAMTDECAEGIEFEPGRLGLGTRSVEL